MERLKRGVPRLNGLVFVTVAICGIPQQAWASAALPESSNAPSTCPSRSINYITQSLPQQCLTSSWTSRESVVPATSEIPSTDAIPSYTETASHKTASWGDGEYGTSKFVVAEGEEVKSAEDVSSVEASQPSAATESEAHATSIPNNQETTTEPDSPLDNANFLSFEDWKRQNLEKAGQSTETFEKREDNGHQGRINRPSMLQSTLDSLGEDTEIDIDFGGFVNAEQLQDSMPSEVRGTGNEKLGTTTTEGKDTDSPHRRSKDAGKTCKERSNYASFDCAATVLKTNQECKGATSVLVENKDSYMLNVCSVKNKFLIVELCDDILIDTIVLANFEFFSSMFRSFRVSVSDRFPVKMDKWKELGVYEARNAREIQAFLVENPLIWARYLRIEFLSHFGKEYYCPLSLLRVHGTTMMEEFNHEVKGRGEDDTDTESVDEISEDVESGQDLVVAIPPSPSSVEVSTVTSAITHTSFVKVVEIPPSTSLESTQSSSHVVSSAVNGTTSTRPSEISAWTALPAIIFRQNDTSDQFESCESQANTIHHTRTESPAAIFSTDSSPILDATPPVDRQESTAVELQSQSDAIATPSPSRASTSSSKTPTSSVQPVAPSPTTQESFFKSVHKRLQQLEANSTLSLQYIEEQSRILREAFSKVEKRQLTKTSDFLTGLNNSVLTELRDFRHQYDQIWQSTVLELSAQREQSRQEMSALSKRLNYLSDDMVFQKRISSLQFMLILICLGFVIFPRHITGTSNHFEIPPFVQNALHRSTASLTSGRTPLNSPPTSPPSTRPASRYGLFKKTLTTSRHRRSPSEESDLQPHQIHKSPSADFSPPTPESIRDGFSEPEITSKAPDDSAASTSSSPTRQSTPTSRSHEGIGLHGNLTPVQAGSNPMGSRPPGSPRLVIEMADDGTMERPSTS